MKDYAPKLLARAGEDLEPGEELLAAVRTQSVADATAAGGAGGVAGAVGGVAAAGILAAFALREARKARDTPTELTPEAMKLAALGLTDRRLAVWARSKMTGRPGALLGALNLGAIAAVGATKGRLVHMLHLRLTDGGELHLEVFRGDDVEHFAQAFAALRG